MKEKSLKTWSQSTGTNYQLGRRGDVTRQVGFLSDIPCSEDHKGRKACHSSLHPGPVNTKVLGLQHMMRPRDTARLAVLTQHARRSGLDLQYCVRAGWGGACLQSLNTTGGRSGAIWSLRSSWATKAFKRSVSWRLCLCGTR